MDPSNIECSASKSKKPERKVIEKNRRNQMKLLYSHLFSLIPPNTIPKATGQLPDRVDTAIEYIQSLKTNLELSKNNKEKLLSRKRSHEDTTSVSQSLNIQIHEMGHDRDAVLVTGLKIYSSFCKVVQLLDKYSTEVSLANFSSSGHSTFHIHHKKIEAEDICQKLKSLHEGSSNTELGDITATFGNQVDATSSIWDFDF